MRIFVRLNQLLTGEFKTIKPIWIDPDGIIAISPTYDSNRNSYHSEITMQRCSVTILVEEKPEELANKCGIKLPLESV